MACDDATAATAALAAALAGPQSMTADGMTAVQRPIGDLIAADKYLAAKCASSNRSRGLRLTKLVPPGTE